MNTQATVSAVTTSPAGAGSGGPRSLWDERFADEKYIWGQDPSETAVRLGDRLYELQNTTALHSTLNVIDVGTGYMRDPKYLHNRCNVRVTGVDRSQEGFNLARSDYDLNQAIYHGWIHTVQGQFAKASIATGAFDAAMSHRTIHLLGNNGEVDAFVDTFKRILKPGAPLYVSARDDRDTQDMKQLPDGQVEPSFRPGHLISHWNEARFKKAFGKDFDILGFVQTEEIESMPRKPGDAIKMTPITIMMARRKGPTVTLP